jgi:uncharacterized protein YqeY
MELKAKIQNDMKEYLKSGQKEKLAVVRMLFTEIRNAEINDSTQPGRLRTNEECLKIVSAYHKSLTKSLAEFPEDRRAPLLAELAIVEEYLPKQLDDEALKIQVAQYVQQGGHQNFGQYMKELGALFQGQVDGKRLSETIKACLAK